MRPTLVVSIALNLLLATSLVLARVDGSRDSGTPAEQHDSSAAPNSAADSSRRARRAEDIGEAQSLSDYYRRLRAAGLDHRSTLVPAAGWVYRSLAAAGPLHDEYWRSNAYEDARRAAVARLSAALRDELLHLYGPEAVERPEFRGLFRPLGARFDFLTSAQQLAIVGGSSLPTAETRADRPGSRLPDCAAGGGAVGTVRGPASIDAGAGPTAGLRSFVFSPELDADSRFEFALRTSPLAAPLRALELDEASFREAFVLLEAYADAAEPTAQLEALRSLESLLGAARAHRVLRRFDPAWPAIAALLEAAEVAPAVTDEAYAAIAESRAGILRLLLDGRGDADLAAAVAEDRQWLRQRLGALVGDAIADKLIAVRADDVPSPGPGRC